MSDEWTKVYVTEMAASQPLIDARAYAANSMMNTIMLKKGGHWDPEHPTYTMLRNFKREYDEEPFWSKKRGQEVIIWSAEVK